MANPGPGRALIKPFAKGSQIGWIAFDKQFDVAVGKVSDPAGEAQAFRFAAR